MNKHYQIRKFVICDIIGQRCTEDYPYSSDITPDCKNCKDYKDYLERKHNEELT